MRFRLVETPGCHDRVIVEEAWYRPARGGRASDPPWRAEKPNRVSAGDGPPGGPYCCLRLGPQSTLDAPIPGDRWNPGQSHAHRLAASAARRPGCQTIRHSGTTGRRVMPTLEDR